MKKVGEGRIFAISRFKHPGLDYDDQGFFVWETDKAFFLANNMVDEQDSNEDVPEALAQALGLIPSCECTYREETGKMGLHTRKHIYRTMISLGFEHNPEFQVMCDHDENEEGQ